MIKAAVIFIQHQLKAMGHDPGPEDGILGVRTGDALNRVPGLPADWSRHRKAVAFIQKLAGEKGIEAGPMDGYWGPQTECAFGHVRCLLCEGREPDAWRPEEVSDENPNGWPHQLPESTLTRYYGAVGENQTRITLPYPHRLSWKRDTMIHGFSCHERVHDSLYRVLERVLAHYGLPEIQRLRLDLWGGCLNVRKKRGGTTPSLHSWGIALDYDPLRNKLSWGRNQAAFARSDYDYWWRLWEEEGWVSLGRRRNFDWMHIQASKL